MTSYDASANVSTIVYKPVIDSRIGTRFPLPIRYTTMNEFDFTDCQDHHRKVHGGKADRKEWTDDMIAGSVAYQALSQFKTNSPEVPHDQAKEQISRVAGEEADRFCAQHGMDDSKSKDIRQKSMNAAERLYFDTNEYRGDS
ncbi:hypothetical protein BC937DRAFT_90208 [Endogone sp. FLAS-F59071]|nr:hypothetical protein BC937DRAFT_90208 [Endogone sp. FLAS-F59071]|eukprot:RUS17255.1 hypothetical protein BC937DRAFT_90208 [Endogone sp. FLAS-F59071]